jgi:hypothetical protein
MTAPDFIWAEANGNWWLGGDIEGMPRYVRRDPAVLAELPEVQALLREEREKAVREAAKVAEDRHQQWSDDSGVECDVTACKDIAVAIRAMIQEAPHDAAHIAIEERGE